MADVESGAADDEVPAAAIGSVRDRLLRERHALLDLSTRNRLLNVPMRTRNVRTIEIVDEQANEIFRLLEEGKGFSFLPGRVLEADERGELAEDDVETGGIPQPEEDALDERGVPVRHTDLRLQTRLTSEALQKRLFDIWYDARTFEEEQGVNILYLGLGLLRWYDAPGSDVARHAPLVLLPVGLERSGAADKFKLKGRGEPPSPNLSLQAKMKADFGIVLDDFDDEDALDIAAYCARVSAAVAGQAKWEVLPDAMVLGFFSFAKFLMYRDLDPDNWPAEAPIDRHEIVAGLLRDGFPETEPLVADDSASIDEVIPAAAMNHVVDADSSQALVIEEAARGRTLVVKGPPGTGKSQTITNIIAAAAAQGKRVLFVAEKMAALDVVHRRLQSVGLGPLTLELHSNKANKKSLLAELKRTRELAAPPRRVDEEVPEWLEQVRTQLNAHVDALHEVRQPYRLSAFQVLGELLRVGAKPSDAALGAAARWSPPEREERRALIAELAARLDSLGDPAEHPWRGVGCDALDPSEQDAILREVAALQAELAALRTAAGAGAVLGAEAPRALVDLRRVDALLRLAASLPECDRTALARPEWRELGAQALALPAAGSAYRAARADTDAVFLPVARDADFMPIRTALATQGRSWFRFLSGSYRAQLAQLRSYLKGPLPSGIEQRIALVDKMLAAQAARAAYDAAAAAGPAYGALWQGEESDWPRFEPLASWRRESLRIELPELFLERIAKAADLQAVHEARVAFDARLPAFLGRWTALAETLSLDLGQAFGVASDDLLPLGDLEARLASWLDSPEAVTRWIAFAVRVRRARALELEGLVEAALAGRIPPGELPAAFDRAYFEALRADIFTQLPELKAFDGELQNRLVERFQSLDIDRIALAREEIAQGHREQMPRGNSGVGPLGVLAGELAKKRNLMPIRQLIDRAGPAIQALKPIFMMSPLSVAQFLRPGAIEFDILVMDEASQIEPVDALGAVARAAQIVVVGDERQLPPTRFFAKLTGEGDEEEDEESEEYQLRASNVDSVLDLCLAKGIPDRMLNWHYRSKHQSLIAVSNREFYDNRLFIVPSPFDAGAGMGLKFHHLPDAYYDRGNTRTNPVEARTVAQAVIAHANEHPEVSLGVATFSTAQRQAILKELELLRRANPQLEPFFEGGGPEPFFVKNLENVQGDERDVIFISVGYGKTSTGYLAMSFGPLNGEGGERRLNVLISRAKLRCEVFSSITGDDIDLERARARGVAALKTFLSFAQTGRLGVAEESGRGPDSPFEAVVAERLRTLGFEVRTQVGVAGFFVDLAIVDPAKPGRFVLGLECDGAQYHSSRSARDRDRLRQAVLESHGWIIHRIWSVDWYLRPKEELAKAEAAIREAIGTWRDRDEEGEIIPASPVALATAETVVEAAAPEVEDAAPAEAMAAAAASEPYVEAAFEVDGETPPADLPTYALARPVARIVDLEGPVHRDEIVARIASLWGQARVGSRTRTAVDLAIRFAAAQKLIGGGPVFWTAPDTEVRVRNRAGVASAGLREVETLPPEEIDRAILSVVEVNFGADRRQLPVAVARLFGFATTSAKLRRHVLKHVDALVAADRLREQGDLLTITPAHMRRATAGVDPGV